LLAAGRRLNKEPLSILPSFLPSFCWTELPSAASLSQLLSVPTHSLAPLSIPAAQQIEDEKLTVHCTHTRESVAGGGGGVTTG